MKNIFSRRSSVGRAASRTVPQLGTRNAVFNMQPFFHQLLETENLKLETRRMALNFSQKPYTPADATM
jgi:hypothetical protein